MLIRICPATNNFLCRMIHKKRCENLPVFPPNHFKTLLLLLSSLPSPLFPPLTLTRASKDEKNQLLVTCLWLNLVSQSPPPRHPPLVYIHTWPFRSGIFTSIFQEQRGYTFTPAQCTACIFIRNCFLDPTHQGRARMVSISLCLLISDVINSSANLNVDS